MGWLVETTTLKGKAEGAWNEKISFRNDCCYYYSTLLFFCWNHSLIKMPTFFLPFEGISRFKLENCGGFFMETRKNSWIYEVDKCKISLKKFSGTTYIFSVFPKNLFLQISVRSLVFLYRVQTPLRMSVTYISSLSFDAWKKIFSAKDRVISFQEFYVPDFLIFV